MHKQFNQLVPVRGQYQAFVNAVVNLRILQKVLNFLTS